MSDASDPDDLDAIREQKKEALIPIFSCSAV